MSNNSRTCTICDRHVHSHSYSMHCKLCHRGTHLACLSNVSRDDSLYKDREFNIWYCPCCVQSIFPFNHYNDDNDFMNAVCPRDVISSDDVSNLENKVLNVFDLDCDVTNDPLSPTDPDANFFNGNYCGNDSLHCRYYTEQSFNNEVSSLNCEPGQLSLLHSNIRSVQKNFRSLEFYLDSLNHNFDVIALTETWLNEVTLDGFNPQHYKTENVCRSNKSGGGVSVMINESLDYKVRNDIAIMNENFESLFVEIVKCRTGSNSNNVIVGVIYRPPNTCVQQFIENLSVVLTAIKKESKLCYILGDFNLNLLNVDCHIATAEFLETMCAFSYLPLITKPTRVTNHSATLIDNIFTNDKITTNSFSGIFSTDISDHFPIFYIDKTT